MLILIRISYGPMHTRHTHTHIRRHTYACMGIQWLGQEASEGSWPPGAEKWSFYYRPSIRIGYFWATARAAEIGTKTTFYSLDKRPKKA